MTESNLKLGRLFVIFGIAFWAIVWLLMFNNGVAGKAAAHEMLDKITYFKDFTAETYSGGTFGTEEIGDAKIVVYNGWGPWCHNCVDEMPSLEKLYQEYRDKGVLVVGIVADYNTQIMKDADYLKKVGDVVEAYDITYPIILSDERFAKEVAPTMTGTFPATWVVDGEGNLIDFFLGGKSEEEWRSLFDEWLEKGGSGNE